MKVVHFQRKQPPGKFSLEGYFKRVRSLLPETIHVSIWTMPFFSQGLIRRFLNIISAFRHQSDVNHITGDVHYVALLLRRRRTILTIADCEVLTRLKGWKRRVVKLFWYTIPARRVSAITVISEETKRILLTEIRFPADAIYVIPVSVSEQFQPIPQPFNAGRPRILQIGTKTNKNIIRLTEALNGVDCQLDIVGPISELQRQALTENNISFENYLQLTDQEIHKLYQQCDIVSFVSTYEGFGMPIVEAQSIERVCVTSNCSSMPEVGGDGACFIDPLDINSIRDGFLRVINDDEYRTALITKGRTNKLRFDARRIAESFAALYESLAGAETRT